MERKIPRIFYNRLSLFGAVVTGLGFFIFLFLFAIQSLTHESEPYAGLVIFIMVPSIMILGILLISLGAFVQWARGKQREEVRELLVIDLTNPVHRNNTIVFLSGVIVFFFLSAFGSYQAYHYTDSVAFCGQLCHSVMKPEFVLYQNSPHARVKCVECHVGAGANWYVKSKMSGLYQVYATLADVYPTPIPTPIENLRPARETCEQCHWPEQFYGAQQRYQSHYLPNEENSEWNVNMLILTGGGSPKFGHSSGIHWHMNMRFEINYIATDEKRQSIPWISAKDAVTDEVTVFASDDAPPDEELEKYEKRRMDCMDCHNRPTHIYRSPNEAVNLALAVGQMDRSLPYVKKVSVEALAADYGSTEEALEKLASTISVYYRNQYPDVFREKEESIRGSITHLQETYTRNFFPEMKARWDDYPDNLGHLNFPGCFRCHDGKHRSPDGRVVSNDCDDCHLILAQGPGGSRQTLDASGMEFVHPEDIGEAWKEMMCSECHTGVLP
jgi:nitrate/TMAO reductase-like tetraheme cytochrome c subunit